MKTLFARTWPALALCCAASAALAAPLESTSLYRDRAKGCRTLDLATWSHPTRKTLEKAGIEIQKVELCNRDVYPIFTVRFSASPILGVNDRFFNRLYAEMSVANGRHSFAFVDPSWGVTVEVNVTGKNSVSLDYDEFDAPAEK